MVRRTIRVRETPDSSSGSPTNMTRSKISKEKIRKTKIVATRSFVAIVCVAIGVLITAQWRSIPDRVTNPIAPYSSLKETKDALYDEQNNLKNEITDLQKALEKSERDSENVSLTKSELSGLRMKKAQAGLTKLNGPGVIITLDDSKGVSSEDSIVHAGDIRDVVNLLWGSGAEAISINDQRVVINTAIDCIVNTVLVNNIRLTTPFRIEAIGNQSLMQEKLTNTNLLSNLYDRKQNQGLIFSVERNNDITVQRFNGSFEVKTGVAN